MLSKQTGCVMSSVLFVKLAVVPLVFCVGCMGSSYTNLTYYTEPPGATIYDECGTRLGKAPVTVRYDVHGSKGQSASLSGVFAIWPSGARVSTGPVRIIFPGIGVWGTNYDGDGCGSVWYNLSHTIFQPEGQSGRALDAVLGAEHEERVQRAQQVQQSQTPNDPVLQGMADFSHVITPLAVEKQLQRGDVKGASETISNYQMLQRLNRMSNP